MLRRARCSPPPPRALELDDEQRIFDAIAADGSAAARRDRTLLTLLGIVIGVLAIVCDVFSIRRFFMVDHKWRWHFTAVATAVIGLLAVLLVQDVVHLLT